MSDMQTDALEDFEELEDGEISSDEELTSRPSNFIDHSSGGTGTAEVSGDYEVLERPITLARRTLQKESEGSSRTLGINSQYQNQQQRPERPTRPTPIKAKMLLNKYDDDDDDDSSSKSSIDSDEEEGLSGEKTRRMQDPQHFQPPPPTIFGFESRNNDNEFLFSSSSTVTSTSASGPSQIMNTEFKNQASMFQQKRKPNNIWSSVLQDEMVSDIFGKVNVEEYSDKHILIDRGPETFSVIYKDRPPVVQRSDSSSLSSGGLTDNELEYLRGGVPVVDDDAKPSTSGFDENQTVMHGRKRRGDPKKRRQRKKRKNRMINSMQKMNSIALGDYIAKKLTEPKTELIRRAVEVIGKEACISLLFKTMKIERRGGLMIKNQGRRRTAGGVYLYLLRGNRHYTKSKIDRIFQPDKDKELRSRKRERNRNRLKRKASLERKNAENIEEEASIATPSPGLTNSNSEPETKMDDDDGGGNASEGQDGDESDVDSDDYFGIQESKELTKTEDDKDPDEDCLYIHCDASDLNDI